MSVPGGPNLPPDNVSAGTPLAYVRWTSALAPKDYYQKTLHQLETAWASPADRWNAVLLLRGLRMRLELSPAQLGAFLPNLVKLNKGNVGIHTKFVDVVSVGRLSQVGKSLGISKIAANPAHLDVDWFNDPLPHWWNDPGFNAVQAEKDLTRELLWFLEDSLGLARSQPLPTAPWSWPPGTPPNDWADLVKTAAPPNAAAGYAQIKLEWHMGKNSGLVCGATTNTFWVGTPKPARFYDF